MANSKLRVAIVADWIIGGGAERVVSELHNLYPDAPIYASYCNPEWRQRLDNKVVTGYLQRWPFSKLRKFAGLISPFRIGWYKNIDFSNFDVVISATGNGEAKHVRMPEGVKHICYCFTPVHYYWRHYKTYLKNPGFGPLNFLARFGLKLLINPLRKKDYAAAQVPDEFVAISRHIQADIKKYYDRDSVVIAPPVNTEPFIAAGQKTTKRQGFVTMGRQTPYKRTDIIVDACTELKIPLTVIGNGPEHETLVKRAGDNVQFPTNISDEEMPKLLAGAEAFLFAATEDFGVAPVEALAAGTPVIALKEGGALDFVEEGVSGAFFDQPTVKSLRAAISSFDPDKFKSTQVQKKAAGFSNATFQKNIKDYVQKVASR